MSEREVAIAVYLAIFARAHRLAQDNNQIVGEKNDLYITLRQLENEFIKLREELSQI